MASAAVEHSQISACCGRSAGLPAIKGFLETSFVDWPGRLCAILFVGGCNFRCPFCHNHPLVLAPEGMETINFEEIINRLSARKKWLGGVCISGGEPTLSPGLQAMISRLKTEGWAIKLDTNGSRPEVLAQLLDAKFLDMVAMDVKTVLEKEAYERCAGGPVDMGAIRKSIDLLHHSGISHEFRMTIAPSLHTEEEISAWVQQFDRSRSRLTLQNFNPRSTLDARLEKEPGFAPEIFSRLVAMVA
jgi:pyruvate formate lyase activating enzyme